MNKWIFRCERFETVVERGVSTTLDLANGHRQFNESECYGRIMSSTRHEMMNEIDTIIRMMLVEANAQGTESV